MKTFIKAIEIWEPDRESTQLTLINGIYGKFKEFASYSKSMHFSYGEGLPGQAWAAQHPIILTQFEGSDFKRTEMANKIGITSAIAMPIFAGEYLHAVILFLCGDTEGYAGAIELWAKEKDKRTEMGLVDGYYGSMKEFEWVSRNVKIMRGHGLPGNAWKSKMPFIINDLGNSATFLRARKASKEGITTALALPAWMNEEDGYVMAFLSAKSTPIAHRFEIWIPDETGEALIFRDGYCDRGNKLDEIYALTRLSKQDSIAGKVWKTGYPVLSDTIEPKEDEIDFQGLLALPILQNGFCVSVVMFYF
jgi:hypothetical protein